MKLVNEQHGVAAGDRLIRSAARQLQALPQARGYHLHGDEFALLGRGSQATAQATLGACLVALAHGKGARLPAVRASAGYLTWPGPDAPRWSTARPALVSAVNQAKWEGGGRFVAADGPERPSPRSGRARCARCRALIVVLAPDLPPLEAGCCPLCRGPLRGDPLA